MGGAFSKAEAKNVIDSTIDAVTSVATNVINNTKISTNQGQLIYVSKTKGDVLISGVHFNQTVNLNVKALLNLMSKNDIKQQIAQQLTLNAKALLDGISLGSTANAINNVNTYINTTLNIATNSLTSCTARASQSQAIIVDTTDGNVKITDVTFDQVSNIISDCINQSLSDNQALQDIQNNIDASAESTIKGVNIWALLIGLIAALIIMYGPAAFILYKYVWIIFLVFAIVGGILIYVYFRQPQTRMVTAFYSSIGITGDSGCLTNKYADNNDFEQVIKAEDACETTDRCQGYDFIVKSGGTPNTKFYSSMKPDPCDGVFNTKKKLPKDSKPFYREPMDPMVLPISSGNEPDPDLNADVVVMTKTGHVWYYLNGGWQDKFKLIKSYNPDINKHIYASSNTPPTSGKETNDLWLDTSNIYNYVVNIFTGSGWLPVKEKDDQGKDIVYDGPGLVVNYDYVNGKKVFPQSAITSGYKKGRNPIFLYFGIPMILFGILGTIISIFQVTSGGATETKYAPPGGGGKGGKKK